MARAAKKPKFPSAAVTETDATGVVEPLPRIPVPPNRTPIPIQLLTFPAQPSMRLYGKPVCTSCKCRTQTERETNRQGYEIEYHPWLRSFKIIYHGGPKEQPKSQFVPDHHVMTWEPYEGDA